MTRIPLLLVGDGPAEPTGLGRIARDLAARLVTASATDSSSLPIDLVQVGGSVPPIWEGGWRHYPLERGEDWGAGQVREYYRELFGDRPGILWVVWDPSRLVEYAGIDLPVQTWAYTAVDSTNIHGRISGPAGDALRGFDRVLAYGRWASVVVKATTGQATSYLPHGLMLQTYAAPMTEAEQRWVRSIIGPYRKREDLLVGCVATNQPRKDLSLFFATVAELKRRGRKVYGWLHTDVLVKAWAVQQLVEDFGLAKQITVTLDTYSDRQLALLYHACDLTIHPGLGEGFGYPIVESLAAGTPVLHGDFGGGAELVPKTEWRIPVQAERLESVYALRRPVFNPVDWANAAERLLNWGASQGEAVVGAYCRGSVAHLGWDALWPRWASWIRKGL